MLLNRCMLDRLAKQRKIGELFSQARHLSAQGKHPIDLTLGNPIEKPEALFYDSMAQALEEVRESEHNPHGYDQNAGLWKTRLRLATDMRCRYGLSYHPEDLFMTVGASSALNVALAAFLDPTDFPEVIFFTPGFMDYQTYIENYGALARPTPLAPDFGIDYSALRQAITPQTRILILNTPHNPSGRVLSPSELASLASFLERENQKREMPLIVLEDAAYAAIYFGDEPPETFSKYYQFSMYATSFSKSHNLAGERLGFLAVNPTIAEGEKKNEVLQALAYALRTQIIQAPSFLQRVVAKMGMAPFVNREALERKVRKLENALRELGYRVRPAKGAYYVFAELPLQFKSFADWERLALEGPEPLLAVPGNFFGGPGYDRFLRFSLTASEADVERAIHRLREIGANQSGQDILRSSESAIPGLSGESSLRAYWDAVRIAQSMRD